DDLSGRLAVHLACANCHETCWAALTGKLFDKSPLSFGELSTLADTPRVLASPLWIGQPNHVHDYLSDHRRTEDAREIGVDRLGVPFQRVGHQLDHSSPRAYRCHRGGRACDSVDVPTVQQA